MINYSAMSRTELEAALAKAVELITRAVDERDLLRLETQHHKDEIVRQDLALAQARRERDDSRAVARKLALHPDADLAESQLGDIREALRTSLAAWFFVCDDESVNALAKEIAQRLYLRARR